MGSFDSMGSLPSTGPLDLDHGYSGLLNLPPSQSQSSLIAPGLSPVTMQLHASASGSLGRASTPRSAGLRGVFDNGRNPLLTPRGGSPASSRPQSSQSGQWYEQPTKIVSPKTTTRGALAAAPSFGRLLRDRYYHHYVPPSKGMRRPAFEAEKPYRMPSQPSGGVPSFLTKENLRLRL